MKNPGTQPLAASAALAPCLAPYLGPYLAPFFALVLALVLALSAGQATAADLAKGREKAEQVCASCHGKDGNTVVDPSYPKLAGQAADYLYQALLGYRNETRRNAIMAAMAKPLTNAEMRNLAAYYESLPGQLGVRK